MAILAAMSLGISLPAAQVTKGLTGTWTEVGSPGGTKAVVQDSIAYFDSSTVSKADKIRPLKGRVLDLPELDRPTSRAHLHA